MAPSPDGLIVNACRAAAFEPRLEILTRDPASHRALYAVLPAEGAHPLARALMRELAAAAEG